MTGTAERRTGFRLAADFLWSLFFAGAAAGSPADAPGAAKPKTHTEIAIASADFNICTSSLFHSSKNYSLQCSKIMKYSKQIRELAQIIKRIYQRQLAFRKLFSKEQF
jgi:hypothetical protein